MSADDPSRTADPSSPSLSTDMRTSEDWWAIWCGAILLVISFGAVWFAAPADLAQSVADGNTVKVSSPLKPWVAKPGSWTDSPVDAFYKAADGDKPASSTYLGVVGVFAIIAVLFALANSIRGHSAAAFLKAFPFVFLLATLAYTLAGQTVVKAYNLEYALWALLVGLIISNTVGTPAFLKPAVLTEFLSRRVWSS